MQAGRNAAEAVKEKASNVGASARAGMEKTKASLEEKGERLTTRDPLKKEMATVRKQERMTDVEIEKQREREYNAARRQANTGVYGTQQTGDTGFGGTAGYSTHPTGHTGYGSTAGYSTHPTGETGYGGITGYSTHPTGDTGYGSTTGYGATAMEMPGYGGTTGGAAAGEMGNGAGGMTAGEAGYGGTAPTTVHRARGIDPDYGTRST